MGVGFRGFQVSGFGFFRFRISGAGFQDSGLRTVGVRRSDRLTASSVVTWLMVWGSSFRIQNVEVLGLGFGGFGFWVLGSELRVEDWGGLVWDLGRLD